MKPCQICAVDIIDSDMFYHKGDANLCIDCAFKVGCINEEDYLKNIPFNLKDLHAEVIDGEIELWQNRKHPLERDDKDERKTKEYRNWRNSVLKRDSFTCQKCQCKEKDLHAHHLKEFAKYKELRFEVDNGITLCVDCHRSVHRRGD